jgi:hypothetical protein
LLSRILGTKASSAPEETTMMHPTTMQALAQAQLADLHHQAHRHALARATRQTRRARSQSGDHAPAIPAALTGQARRPSPEPESS